ncbi:alcohol dehydrogenase 3 [Canna indica]|uniref:alcohol dehydrogenase n=1 Tax=Canna indica TaxID=4628 RepID=A0AAQ3KKM3_9LILI|nr:alcohol dehydrogenase 3 [Canna indica]
MLVPISVHVSLAFDVHASCVSEQNLWERKTSASNKTFGWGVAVLIGAPHKDAVFKTHPVNFLTERTLKGTFYGHYKPRTDLPGVVEMYMNKEIDLEKFIIHEVSFSKINKAFDLMLQGASLRCIIRMDD